MTPPSAPLVSILINNYNYAGFLGPCIESALAQRHPNVEVVVVDDCSKDDSRAVLARYGSRVVAVLQERNGGQGAAINAGVRAARGDIVMLLDADDYLYPQAAERVAAAWSPGLSKVHYRLDLVDAGGRFIDVYPPREVFLGAGDVVPQLLRTGRYETPVTSGNAFSRAVLSRILPIPEEEFRISADGYLVTVAPFHGPVGLVDEALGAYRQHGANAWATASGPVDLAHLAERARRSLAHDALKLKALSAAAAARGLRTSPSPELNDRQHLDARLASLLFDPARHPVPADVRPVLGWRGAVAALGDRTPLRRRLVLAGWFLGVGILPRGLARRLAAWRLAPATRPAWSVRLFRLLRRSVSWAPGSRPGPP